MDRLREFKVEAMWARPQVAYKGDHPQGRWTRRPSTPASPAARGHGHASRSIHVVLNEPGKATSSSTAWWAAPIPHESIRRVDAGIQGAMQAALWPVSVVDVKVTL